LSACFWAGYLATCQAKVRFYRDETVPPGPKAAQNWSFCTVRRLGLLISRYSDLAIGRRSAGQAI
jgi:hypothetical protein